MGTHISKVKSVDLDSWTPEQMASITKWGNHLANLYWEAHLKAGHVPPEHKMESFIRSKYESRRWAREGPVPTDPSVLEDGAAPEPAVSPTTTAAAAFSVPTAQRPTHASSPSVGSARGVPLTNRQPQPHQLLSTAIAGRTNVSQATTAQPQPTSSVAAPPAAPASAANDLFSLDFHNPTPTAFPSAQAPKKDAKQDILSLFSTPAPNAANPAANAFGQFASAQPTMQQNVWGGQQWGATPAAVQPAQAPVTSMVGNNGTSMWGASSGWNASPATAQPQSNLWGGATTTMQPTQRPSQPAAQPSLFNTNDVWGSSGSTAGGGGDLFGSTLPGMQKKDDVFGDIWGGSK